MKPVFGKLKNAVAAFDAGDYQIAFRLFKPLAEQRVTEAQAGLAFFYFQGKGVPEDDAKADYLYRKAAERGHVEAQIELGDMYDEGKGIPEDDAKAVHWYRKAAEQGYARAQQQLGWSYLLGKGVPEDNLQAYAWMSIAAAQGSESAMNSRGTIKGSMTPAQIAEAQKLSSELWEKYVMPFQKD